MKPLDHFLYDNDLLMQFALIVIAVMLLAFLVNIYFYVVRSDKFDDDIEHRYQGLDNLLTRVMDVSSDLKAIDYETAFTPLKQELTPLLRLTEKLARDIRSFRTYDLDKVKRSEIANAGPIINALDKFEKRLEDIEEKKVVLEIKLRVPAVA